MTWSGRVSRPPGPVSARRFAARTPGAARVAAHPSGFDLGPALVGYAVPQTGIGAIGLARRGHLVAEAAQVLARPFRSHAALRRAIKEAELQQIRLVDVLDRLHLFADDRGNGRATDGTGRELLDDGGEQAAVRRVEALVVDIHRVHRGRRLRRADVARRAHLRVVAHAAQQPVDDARRAAAAAGDHLDGVRFD